MPALGRPQLLVYAALALLVGLLGARALRAERPAADGAPGAVVEGAGAVDARAAKAPGGPEPGTPGAGTAGAEAVPGGRPPNFRGAPDVVVHVAGAVRRPGVYRMAAGARVQDAVAQAGGPRRGADVHRLNLAARVTDGQQVLIPRRGQAAARAEVGGGSSQAPASATPSAAGAAASGGAPLAVGGPVDLNTATIAELETLDGVGPAIAQKIVDWRQANGGFRSVDDLAQVSGIGPKKLEAMRPRVRV